MAEPDCRLYLITPPALDDLAAFGRALGEALQGGDVGAVQLRLKGVPDEIVGAAAHVIQPMTQARDIPLILNDRPDLAVRFGCDGVHIGQDDAPYAEARRIVGHQRIVGVTCHNSRHLAIEAAEAGADYVAFGAFFATSTKQPKSQAEPELIQWWAEMMVIPCVAIGGITIENCRPLIEAGVDFLAVSSGVWDYRGGPAAAVKAFNSLI